MNKLFSISVLLLILAFVSEAYAQKLAPEVFSSSSYAVDVNGNLYAWGLNNAGQLGTGTAGIQTTPQKVSFPNGVTSWKVVAAGEYHTIAIGNDGNLYSWGFNAMGQLGLGNTTNQFIPQKVSFPNGVTSWTAIAAGAFYSLAVGNDGNLYAWGSNVYGQLGIGNAASQLIPQKVILPNGVTGWTSIAAGGLHSLAISNDGNLYAWGYNAFGELGIGTTSEDSTPVKVSLPSGAVSWIGIAAGAYHSLAISRDSNTNFSLYAWGWNAKGQLGIGNTINQLTPQKITLPDGVTSWTTVACGVLHSLAVGNDGNLYTWGDNEHGQLGIGTTSDNSMPVKVTLPDSVTGWTAIVGGYYHSLGIGNNGNFYAWGANNASQLGSWDTVQQNSPVKVSLKVQPTNKYNLDVYMEPIWEHDTTYDETVLMLKNTTDSLAEGSLLYTPDSVISVTSFDLSIKYQQGKDYIISGNKILVPQGSAIPYYTGAQMYPASATSYTTAKIGGGYLVMDLPSIHFNQLQLAVTYTHKEIGFSNYVPPVFGDNLIPKTINKLEKGTPFKMVVYGASIEGGAEPTGFWGMPPYTPGFAELLRLKLLENYKSAITITNPSIGGKASDWGRENAYTLVASQSPDLVILSWGMGDAFMSNNFSPAVVKSNIQAMIDTIRYVNPNCEFILVSSMLANPESVGFSGRQADYVQPMEELQNENSGVEYINVTSAHQFMLTRKKFWDMSGNGVNHPGDFLCRLYAQLIYKAFDNQDITSVKHENNEVPKSLTLQQNYPNPFNPSTEIKYSIPQSDMVTVKIYNLLGQEVATLVHEVQKPGNYTLRFNASKLASGVYIYRLQAGNFSLTKKMMLLK